MLLRSPPPYLQFKKNDFKIVKQCQKGKTSWVLMACWKFSAESVFLPSFVAPTSIFHSTLQCKVRYVVHLTCYFVHMTCYVVHMTFCVVHKTCYVVHMTCCVVHMIYAMLCTWYMLCRAHDMLCCAHDMDLIQVVTNLLNNVTFKKWNQSKIWSEVIVAFMVDRPVGAEIDSKSLDEFRSNMSWHIGQRSIPGLNRGHPNSRESFGIFKFLNSLKFE